MSFAFFTGMPGWSEGLLVLLVILLLFGARRLPDLARSLGKSLSEFKKGKEEGAKSSVDTDTAEEKEKNSTGDKTADSSSEK